MNKLSERFAMTDDNLAERRTYVGIDAALCARLEGLLPWAEVHAPQMAREFYDQQFGFGPTRRFFEATAAKKGVSVSTLREHLEATNAKYLLSIFAGAKRGYDLAYFEARLQVGAVHDRIDLPMKFYLGAYVQMAAILRRYLLRSFDAQTAAGLDEDLGRVFNFDMQAVADAYMLSVFDSMGLALERVEVEDGEDRASHIGQAKEIFSSSVRAMQDLGPELCKRAEDLGEDGEQISRVVASTRERAARVSDDARDVSAAVQTVASASEEMSAAVNEIAQSAARAQQVTAEAVQLSGSTRARFEALEASSQKIAHAVALISSIADRTNLLALNATITAARAGERGRAFAVVATEVKALSGQTAEAAENIGALLREIRDDVTQAASAVSRMDEITSQVDSFQASVAASVEEQAATTGEISQAAQRVAERSANIAAQMADVAQSCTDAEAASESSRSSVRELERAAKGLDRLLEQFDLPRVDGPARAA